MGKCGQLNGLNGVLDEIKLPEPNIFYVQQQAFSSFASHLWFWEELQ